MKCCRYWQAKVSVGIVTVERDLGLVTSGVRFGFQGSLRCERSFKRAA